MPWIPGKEVQIPVSPIPLILKRGKTVIWRCPKGGRFSMRGRKERWCTLTAAQTQVTMWEGKGGAGLAGYRKLRLKGQVERPSLTNWPTSVCVDNTKLRWSERCFIYLPTFKSYITNSDEYAQENKTRNKTTPPDSPCSIARVRSELLRCIRTHS